MFGWFRDRKRKQIAEQPFPEEWLAYLNDHVAFWSECPEVHQEKFLTDLKIFAHEKHWFGAGGLEMTDEIRVVVSAAAARLILHLDLYYYDRLTEIVVYPSAYRHPNRGVGHHDGAVILGEARDFGTVVLAWDAVLHGLANPHDGHDTATHELAHVLDRDGGAFNGTPRLRSNADYHPWATVMSHHFFALQDNARQQRAVLRRYGATNEAEFFAVATESFFEKPTQMREHTPDLYDILREFYGFDPCD